MSLKIQRSSPVLALSRHLDPLSSIRPPGPIESKYSCASRISLWRSKSWTKLLHCWRKRQRKPPIMPRNYRPWNASSSSDEITLNLSRSESLACKILAELRSELTNAATAENSVKMLIYTNPNYVGQHSVEDPVTVNPNLGYFNGCSPRL